MTFLTKIAAGIAVVSLAACDASTMGQTSSSRAPTGSSASVTPASAGISEAVQVVANIVNDVARNSPPSASGLRMLGAAARGNTLVIQFQFPFAAGGISRAEFNALYGARLNQQTQEFLCNGDIFRSLITIGATIQVDLLGRDNVRFGNTTVTSC